MSWLNKLGVDKLVKLGRIVKERGGLMASVKEMYLMDNLKSGRLVGKDKFGNLYFEDNSHHIPKNRWVKYPDKVWLDYDPSQIPAEWHRWLHHICDDPPTIDNPVPEGDIRKKWLLDHRENNSLDPNLKYVPYSTTRTKIQAWEPGQKKTSEGL
uniref:NADH dehydrogenase [ubiquinone] 1 alpha subcomplex subunit 12 n=1 Tax=Acrobeloides nanus TaxID=290746 RepID=A0A914BX96_9BILA